MKSPSASIVFCCTLALFLLSDSHAFSAPARRSQQNPLILHEQSTKHSNEWAFSASTAAAAALIWGSTLTTLPQPVHAASTTTNSAYIFNHEYADPLHPYCDRKIRVSADGKRFHYSGTAVGPKGDTVLRGCSPEEVKKYKLREGAFDGDIVVEANGRFGISAGDGIHEGIWEPKDTAATNLGYEDVDGIRWNDGNK